MSIKAMSVVLGFSMGRGNGSRKLVLLGYANHADKHGRTAHPSKNTIAEYCECDTRTAQRHLDWLVGHGYLREGDQHYVEHLDPRRRPIVYDLAMSEDQVERWAAEALHTSGIRARASKAGRVGGQITARKRWGDKLSPQDTEPASDEDATSGGDSISWGDDAHPSGATGNAVRGDNSVAQTVPEPSSEPSSSPRTTTRERAPALHRGGGEPITTDALALLPKSVRDHPSVVAVAIRNKSRCLTNAAGTDQRFAPRLVGIETADKPGAAALARLASLAEQDPPTPRPARPRWCGQCDQRTRMRENTDHDDRPYRCPRCHPKITATDAGRIKARGPSQPQSLIRPTALTMSRSWQVPKSPIRPRSPSLDSGQHLAGSRARMPRTAPKRRLAQLTCLVDRGSQRTPATCRV